MEKINVENVPEATYYSQLSNALGSFRQDTDWESIGNTLAEFSDYSGKQILSIGRIRNDQLAAGVYVAGKRDLGAIGIDAYERAIDLLERALGGTKNLLQDVLSGDSGSDKEELESLQRQILRDLASDYAMAYTTESKAVDYDRSIALYNDLLGMLSDEAEIKEIRFRIADTYRLKGNEKDIRNAYENLIARYSEDADAYIGYASWLYDQGNLEEAAKQYKRASQCENAKENSNYTSLGIKLKNADAL